MAEAIGTSLVVIAAQSAAGLLGHLHHVQFDWPLTLAVTAIAVALARNNQKRTPEPRQPMSHRVAASPPSPAAAIGTGPPAPHDRGQ